MRNKDITWDELRPLPWCQSLLTSFEKSKDRDQLLFCINRACHASVPPTGPFFLCRRQSSHLICDWISHYIQWKNIKSIAKIQDREEIFLDVVTGTSCVDLKEQEFR